MDRKIITHPHEILATKAEPLEAITPEVEELATDMTRIMYDNQGIGLAAPQIGISSRIITVDVSGPDKREDLRIYINPEIVSASGSVSTEEGCLSVVGYRAEVRRASRISFRALDLNGNEVKLEADERLAVCLQHELDHLNGTLFIDRISRLKRSLYEKKLRKWLSKKAN